MSTMIENHRAPTRPAARKWPRQTNEQPIKVPLHLPTYCRSMITCSVLTCLALLVEAIGFLGGFTMFYPAMALLRKPSLILPHPYAALFFCAARGLR